MNLLLVEDEPAIRTALGRALGRWGHRVTIAESIAEGREAAHSCAPEALISDLKLPDGSGLDLAIDLGIPFILMSGYGNFEDAVSALRNGCVDFLTKPVALDQLKAAIHRLGEEQGSGPTVISGAADCRVVRPLAGELRDDAVQVRDLQWQQPAEAEAHFQAAHADQVDLRLAQVMAELLQIPGANRLVHNSDAQGHRLWLPLDTDWEDASHHDRRLVIDTVADRVWWRPQGVMVEIRHEY